MKTKKPVDDGIYLDKYKDHKLDIALISLKIGFEAYYSTYQSVKRFLSIVETRPDKDEFDFDNAEKSFNSIHILNRAKAETSFTKAYIETILHFHHFIELTIKELLRRQNELLPYKISKKKGMLDKILNGEILNPHENEKHSLGFSDSLELMKELMNRGKFSALKNYKLYFEDEGPLCELNLLRNRLVHRTVF